MALPELPEEVKIWWESLQETLDTAGFDLDLTSPEDTARLFVVTINKKGYDNYSVSTSYACDPMSREIDVNNITEQEILARQSLGDNQLAAVIISMYNRAKEGRLYVRTLPTQEGLPRQIYVGEDGKPALGSDFNTPTKLEDEVTQQLDEPDFPQKPSKDVYKKAAAGNGFAQRTIREYESDLKEYPDKMEEWAQFKESALSKVTPEFFERSRVNVITGRHYFIDIETDRNFPGYVMKLAALHRQVEYRKMPEEERTVVMNRDIQTKAFSESLDRMTSLWSSGKNSNGKWSPAMSDILARLLVSRKELHRGEETLKNGTSRYFIPLSKEQTDAAVNEMKNSEGFKEVQHLLAMDDLSKIVSDTARLKPDQVRSRLENLCDKLITEDGLNEMRGKWWQNLQRSLDEAGCELDLNSPEDLARLLIFDVKHNGPNDFTSSASFAADPESKTIDLATITREEILARQTPGVPDETAMRNILNAAYEGRLFVVGHKEAAHPSKPRPIIFDYAATPKVGADMDHMSDADLKYTEVLDKPVAPADPGSWNSIKAAFGNTEANNLKNDYRRNQADYEKRREAWDNIQKSDPYFVTRARNHALIGQTFFYNHEETGVNLIRFDENLSALHKISEARKISDPKQRAATEDINRHRDRIVSLINSTYAVQNKAHRLSSQGALSPQNKLTLSKIFASQQEILRAQRATTSHFVKSYKPLSDEELDALASDIRAEKRFNLIASKLNGEFLSSLANHASRGATETVTFLTNSCKQAYNSAIVDPEFDALRKSFILKEQRSGKRLDTQQGKKGLYTFEIEGYIDKRLGQFVERAIPGNGKELSGEQLDYLRTNGSLFAGMIQNDPLEYTVKFSDELSAELMNTMKPGVAPLTPRERSNRAENARILREKFCEFGAKRAVAIAAADNEYPKLDRPLFPLLDFSLEPGSYLANEKIKTLFSSGTPQEKHDFLLDALKKFSETDISGIDVMNDESFMKNIDRLLPIASVGVEVASLVKDSASKYGIDLTGEEHKPLIEKLGVLADTAYMIRARADIMTHPMYAELRLEELTDRFDMLEAHDAKGEPFSISEFIEERGEVNNAALGAIEQVGMIAHLSKGNPLFDTSIKEPEKRVERYKADFWNGSKEVMPKEPRVVLRRGELFENDENHYNDYAEDFEVDDIEVDENDDIVKELSAEAAENSDGSELFDSESERNLYKAKFRENLRLIQQFVPGLTVTEEELENYVSDERIELHKQALKKFEDAKAARDELGKDHIPESFTRIQATLYDYSGTDEAKAKNEKLKENLTSATPEANEARRNMLLNVIHNVADLDAEKLDDKLPIEERGKYALEHFHESLQGVDFKYVIDGSERSLGFTFAEEDREYLDNLRTKGQSLGGKARSCVELMANEAFLTIPFDKLTSEQSMRIASKLGKKKGLPISDRDYRTLPSQLGFLNTELTYTEPGEKNFSVMDIYENKPESLDQIQFNFSQLYDNLKKADAWYNWRNSDQYDDLLTALRDAGTEFSKISGHIDPEQDEALHESIRKVNEAANDYVKHVSGQKKVNDRRAERLGYAKKLVTMTSSLTFRETVYNELLEKHNNEPDRAYYADVRDNPEAAISKDGTGSVKEREEVFTQGLDRTDRLRKEIDRLSTIEIPTTEEEFELDVNTRILNAREKLTQMVGRDNIKPDELLRPVAEIMQGTRIKTYYSQKSNGMKNYEKLVDLTLKDDAFTQMVSEMKSDDLNKFLAGPGEHTFLNNYIIASKNAKIEKEKSKSAPGKKIEKGKSAPGKKDENVLPGSKQVKTEPLMKK